MSRPPPCQGRDAAWSRGLDGQPTGIVFDVDAHGEVICGEDLREALRPLHQGQPRPRLQALLQPDPFGLTRLQSVDIGVQQGQPPLVLRDQDEGRADDVVGDAQPIPDALTKAGLSCPQITTKRDNGTRGGAGTKGSSEGLGR